MEKKMQKCAEDPKERMTTPQADGFFMPGEYEPHDGCILIWPERPGSWKNGAAAARKAFRSVIAAIAESETVYVAVNPHSRPSAERMLAGMANVRLLLPNSVLISFIKNTKQDEFQLL